MTLALNASSRKKLGKEVKEVRKGGFVPAVLYGKKQEAASLQVDERQFMKLYKEAGEATLVDLTIDEKAPIKVLIHDLQTDPVTQNPIHVDFYAVDMTQEIEAEIELNFIGESKVVKEQGGILVKNHDTMHIKCLPSKLVSHVDVDISSLETFEDKITYSQIVTPEGITIEDKPEVIVAFVAEPRSEKELEELDEKIEDKLADVEVEEKGKEKEEGEEEGKEEQKDQKKEEK